VACNKAIEVCKAQGKSIVKLALQYAMRNHDIATTLVGMNSIEQVCLQLVMSLISFLGDMHVGAEFFNELLR
jgi:aryl-alcohol dehydrogenase-like predicted oxidoreductase